METAFFRRLPGVEFYGNFPEKINGFWNDTRTLQSGDCFLALTARRDGHDFLPHAQRNGASCAIVNRIDKSLTLPQLSVSDVFEAAKTIAKIHRKRYTIVAVTGSYGKTSTKDMLKLLLGEDAYATKNNLNNELGVTLTLSRMKSQRFGIIEGGIDHPGEMDRIIDLVEPEISITIGIIFTHVCHFTDFGQLVKEKCKILENTLSRQNMGIISESCLAHAPFQRLVDRCIVVGRREDIRQFPHFTHFRLVENNKIILRGKYFDNCTFLLPAMSTGQKENFAKAATAAKILEFSDATIGERILEWKPGKMRGETIYFHGHKVYLDCYNANPVAMWDALGYFDQKYTGVKTYVLGGMGELGEFSENNHKKLAEYFLNKKNIIIFAIGVEMKVFCEQLTTIPGAMEIFYFEETGPVKAIFRERIRGNIFIKGSQHYRLWELLET
ncbi:MAG: UDP-N-acetylmuramoyl-tripeptide--D-alanyl-D-alanine ligase [Puniceicoccales bacterium]|jgi:UDP-N-acetylmuramoyl-tripeptide--D-alanyl-D-alanine ligase|nr:UDP-N-acetylmuramoyl-tripeptide--D-alanyl-D-alanine ligase [Puniceicoccales bacterium]